MLKNAYSHRDLVVLLRGIGIGLIIAAIFFFSFRSVMENTVVSSISDSEIISKAESLGMIKITDIERVYLTDEQVIEKAKELGMTFEESPKN